MNNAIIKRDQILACLDPQNREAVERLQEWEVKPVELFPGICGLGELTFDKQDPTRPQDVVIGLGESKASGIFKPEPLAAEELSFAQGTSCDQFPQELSHLSFIPQAPRPAAPKAFRPKDWPLRKLHPLEPLNPSAH